MKDIICQCGDPIQPNDDALCGNCALEFHANKRKIESLKREIATLKEALERAQADNRSLVEQMNQMALKPNQEVIEMKNKDKFRMRVSIVIQYENTTHSAVIKYNDDPTCDKVLQDFVDVLLDYGYHEESILKALEAVTIY